MLLLLFTSRSLRLARVFAINEAASARPIRTYAAINENLGGLGADEWVRVTPYGDFPVTVRVDGAHRRVIQKVDRAAAEGMVAAFNSVVTTLGTLGRGLPIFEGHVDDPEWLSRHPGARKAAVGRLKKLEARDDGLYALPAFNDQGDALVRGEAPAYVAHSPHWELELIGDRATTRQARPTVLRSLALTNTPNIPGNVLGLNEDEEPVAAPASSPTMKKELVLKLLATLGQTLAADAAPEAIDAALAAATTKAGELATTASNREAEKKTAADKLAAAETKATTAANEATTLKTSLAAERSARSCVVVDLAVKAGRIPEAKRAEWVTALNEAPDFAAKSAELEKITPTINTHSQVGAINSRREESAKHTAGITAINEAVAEHMATHGINDRDVAWRAVKQAKPELFK
jgi:phage I-like protein